MSIPTLGARLKDYRLTKAHMTIEQLSRAAGVAVGTISDIENNKHDPRVSTVAKMLRAMGSKTGQFKII